MHRSKVENLLNIQNNLFSPNTQFPRKFYSYSTGFTGNPPIQISNILSPYKSDGAHLSGQVIELFFSKMGDKTASEKNGITRSLESFAETPQQWDA